MHAFLPGRSEQGSVISLASHIGGIEQPRDFYAVAVVRLRPQLRLLAPLDRVEGEMNCLQLRSSERQGKSPHILICRHPNPPTPSPLCVESFKVEPGSSLDLDVEATCG